MHIKRVRVIEDALDANSTIARANREDFDRAGVAVLNFMSSPGSGKTSLLERALPLLEGRIRAAVLEGDVQGHLDADRLGRVGVPVVQINTDPGFGGECHLDANMVRAGLGELPLDVTDLLVVENVGNLVCPAEFRIGEDARVMVASVTEGEDKPLKYPLMFRTCDLVLVNKIDLLPHLDFDMDRFERALEAVCPGVERIRVSARTGEGLEAWAQWLVHEVEHAREDMRERGVRGAAAGAAAGRVAPSPSPRHAFTCRPANPAMATTLDADPAIAAALRARAEASDRFFSAEAGRLARLCHRMAERFARGARLIACGTSAADRSDARHVAVEFVHPVIVGKRALPALGLTPDGGPLPLQAELLVESSDILIAFGGSIDNGPGRVALNAVAFGDDAMDVPAARDALAQTDAPDDAGLRAAVAVARARGALTLGFAPLGAEWELMPPSEDPFIRQELIETTYHLLWELVHVFFEHRGLLEDRARAEVHDPGGSRFLYPFLVEEEHDLGPVLEDVRRSVLMKAEELDEIRHRMLEHGSATLRGAALAVRRSLDVGGRLLAFGNGGSATDAMDVVADFRAAPQGWPRRAALDLTEDPAILSAITNDIGPDAVFARQVIAYGREGDVALAFSTSGDSRNVLAALAEARRRGIATVVFTGYDGGRIAAARLADAVVVAPSQHIPRIQEAHATAYHLIRELVERG